MCAVGSRRQHRWRTDHLSQPEAPMSRAVVVTLAAGAICALAVPRAHAASSPPSRIEAIEKITPMPGPATGAAGPRQGDSLAYTSTMSDRLGHHLGSGAGQCMVIAVRAGKI